MLKALWGSYGIYRTPSTFNYETREDFFKVGALFLVWVTPSITRSLLFRNLYDEGPSFPKLPRASHVGGARRNSIAINTFRPVHKVPHAALYTEKPEIRNPAFKAFRTLNPKPYKSSTMFQGLEFGVSGVWKGEPNLIFERLQHPAACRWGYHSDTHKR